jgi:hypothetical protein
MSVFSSENMRRMAETAKAGAMTAYEKSRSAAVTAGKYASETAEAAVKSAQTAAREFAGGSPALALIGQDVVVLGKQLRIESLIAEGMNRVAAPFHLARLLRTRVVGALLQHRHVPAATFTTHVVCRWLCIRIPGNVDPTSKSRWHACNDFSHGAKIRSQEDVRGSTSTCAMRCTNST